MITTQDIHWTAGFLEGEGCFHCPKLASNSIVATADQVQKQPLEKLQTLLGGRIHLIKRKPPYQDIWSWHLGASRAAGLMMTLYILMSPKRQAQILKCLTHWKKQRIANKYKTHCSKGHALTPENLYWSGGYSRCRTCAIEDTLTRNRQARLG